MLKAWKQTTQFSTLKIGYSASPAQIGRLPWSYDQIWRVYQKAGAAAGIGGLELMPFGIHSVHGLTQWAPLLRSKQKLMRHSDVRTTMNVYGDVVTDEMSQAASKVVGLALKVIASVDRRRL